MTDVLHIDARWIVQLVLCSALLSAFAFVAFRSNPVTRRAYTLIAGLMLTALPFALAMTKSELIDRIAKNERDLTGTDVELAVKTIVDEMTAALAQGERIEIRGFGSFALQYRAPRVGRTVTMRRSISRSGDGRTAILAGYRIENEMVSEKITSIAGQ